MNMIVKFNLHFRFSGALSFLRIRRYDSADLRPKPKFSGLEVEANLDFPDKNFYSHCSNINKQGLYVQFHYRGLV